MGGEIVSTNKLPTISVHKKLVIVIILVLTALICVHFSRPKCVDEVAFQEEVIAVLKKSLEGADVSVYTH